MTADSWKITLPCTKAEAETLTGDVAALADLDSPPVLMTSEPDPARPDDWQLDAYLDAAPNAAMRALILSLVPSASAAALVVTHIPAEDWVTLSQRDLRPINAGRFHVYTSAYAGQLSPHQIGLHVEAGQAFGTGQHETTAGCLTLIDQLAESGAIVANALDLGTGSGILTLGIVKRWPNAHVLATDIDPVSIDVTAENVEVNGERLGDGAGQIALAVADGMAHPAIAARAPYDLIAANILAVPLIAMAADIVPALRTGGRLLLAGLLAEQADAVLAAYAATGARPVARHDAGDWPTLMLTRD